MSTAATRTARTDRRRGRAQRAAGRAHPRRDRSRGRLDRLRPLHAAGPVRAGARLLQRRCAQVRGRGRFRHGAGSCARVQPVPGRAVRGSPAELGREAQSCSSSARARGRWPPTLLEELERRGRLPAEYWILDLSADLRERQHSTLAAAVPHLLERVRWLDGLPGENWVGMIVANEVLDALAIERFAIRAGDVHALGVGSNSGGCSWPRFAPTHACVPPCVASRRTSARRCPRL